MLVEVTVENDQVTKREISFKPFNLAFRATPGLRTSIDLAQMLCTVESLTAKGRETQTRACNTDICPIQKLNLRMQTLNMRM